MTEQTEQGPQQIYCDTCGLGLDPTLDGPYCEEPTPGLHLVDGPNGTKGRYIPYVSIFHTATFQPFRGVGGPPHASTRRKKRALKKMILSLNRKATRSPERISCAGPSEKAVARAHLREAERVGAEAEGEDF